MAATLSTASALLALAVTFAGAPAAARADAAGDTPSTRRGYFGAGSLHLPTPAGRRFSCPR